MNIDQGGGHIDVQGIRCYLPPQPPNHQIQNYGIPKKQQKWIRPELPVFRAADVDVWDGFEYDPDDVITWDEACRLEKIKIYGTDPYDLDKSGNERRVIGVEPDPDYEMECLRPFRERELTRVFDGHWIFINGKAYYLTGNAYLYWAWWPLTDGYAEFRYTDLELFYFWESVKNSKNLLGIIYITMRGVGKSFIAACINYYEAISKRKANTTIQSINDKAAADFFRDKILMPFKSLPNFLIPIHKHGIGDITSNSTLEFVPPARKGMSVRLFNKMKEDALYSKLAYANASETGADGGTWALIVADEVGKTDPSTADVYKRTMINRQTVFRGNKKLGNQFLCSTVEEMESGGLQCLKIWKESDHTKLNEALTTNTGLARFFRSALETTYFDEYGFPIVYTEDKITQKYLVTKYGEQAKMGAKPFHDAMRKSLSHDSTALIGYKQKNPYSENEAFWININKCVYNAAILLDAKDRIENSGKKLVRLGDIVWKEKDKEAIFVDNDKNGKWQISFTNFDQNQVKINEGHKNTFTPMCAHKRIIGIDPYSVKDLAVEGSGSNGAMAVYNRYDMNIPEEFCDTIIADYLWRQPDPFDFYEDCLAAAFWFGCPLFIETNKSNAMDYFRQRGYAWGYAANPNDFIWERPRSTFTKGTEKDTDGMYNSAGTIEHYTNSTHQHIVFHGHKLKHIRVIDDWLKFNPLKTKFTDMAVAASMAVVGAERRGIDVSPSVDLLSLLGTYDNSGLSSQSNN